MRLLVVGSLSLGLALTACASRSGGGSSADDTSASDGGSGSGEAGEAGEAGESEAEGVDSGNDEAADEAADDAGDETTGSAGCEQNSECVVASATCCGVCSIPTVDDVVGVHVNDLDSWLEGLCEEGQPCPDCVQGFNPYLVATCEDQECRVEDLQPHPANACASDDDCFLRPQTCCVCSNAGPEAWMAVTADAAAALEGLVCDDPHPGCPECDPEPPAELAAICDGGFCAVGFGG